MAISVNSATHVQVQAAVPKSAAREAAAKPQTAVPQRAPEDTVKISASAQALQEATETSAQTAKEAGSGDVQARSLLARQAAAHATK